MSTSQGLGSLRTRALLNSVYSSFPSQLVSRTFLFPEIFPNIMKNCKCIFIQKKFVEYLMGLAGWTLLYLEGIPLNNFGVAYPDLSFYTWMCSTEFFLLSP
jgi:hypothetical protein